MRVTNNSAGAAAANCRVQRGGSVGAGDLEFFTEQIPAGETREYTKIMPPPACGQPYFKQPGRDVRCALQLAPEGR